MALAMAVILTCVVPAFAASLSATLKSADDDGIYIATMPVPAGATAHARSSIAGLLCNKHNLNRITLGTPFTLQGCDCDLYYFPVMYEGSIVGMYRVFTLSDGSYTGIYAEDPNMVAALNALANTTSRLSPAQIVVGQYEDLYAVTPTSVYTVLPDYAGRVTPAISVRTTMDTVVMATEPVSVVDVSESIGFVDNVGDTSLRATASSYRYLTWTITETQGEDNWCAAYATAAICRYVLNTNSYTAKGIMRWAHPTASEENLPKKSLSRIACVSYGQQQGLSPQIVNAWPGIATIKAEIDSDCPVYFAGERTGESHAFVCRGYNMNTDSQGNNNPYFSVWNPWYPYTEIVYASTNNYTTGSGKVYTMTAYIRNWE